uniref:Uncharacterized protein n=1 Tax=Arundo donax TaxID=35708 RepID=A0A0A8ZEP9_ARUDO
MARQVSSLSVVC